MGVPVAAAKHFTWIVRKRRLKASGGVDKYGPQGEKVSHPGDYYPSADAPQFMPNDGFNQKSWQPKSEQPYQPPKKYGGNMDHLK